MNFQIQKINSKAKSFILIGEKNGVLRVQPMDDSKKMENLKSYWSYGFHDVDYGQITNICLSYDEKYLFSVGADSNIFGILFNSSLDDLEKAKQDKIKISASLVAILFFFFQIILLHFQLFFVCEFENRN